MCATRLSDVDARPGKPLRVDSLWTILQRGYEIDPNQIALVAPTQPPDLHEKLVGLPTPSPRHDAISRHLYLRRVASRCTRLISRLLLPAPSLRSSLVWSFAQLRCAAFRLGSVLDSHGIPRQSTLLVILPSCAEWALMQWISALNYYTLITLDVAVLKNGQEQTLQNYIATLNPSIVVVGSQGDAMAVDRARSESQTKQNHFLGVSLQPLSKPQPSWTSLREICNQKFPENLDAGSMPPEDPDRVAMIVFTSGTSTGIPKGCVWTVRDLLRPLTATAGLPPLRGPAVLVNTKSSQSMAPCLLYSTWHSGNAAVLAGGSLNLSTTISTIASCRPIGTALYPHMVDSVTEHVGSSPDKLASVRFLLVIGSVTTVESIRRAQKAFPRARIVASYGMTEAAGMFGWPRGPPSVKTIPVYKGIASCGMPLPGAKIRILNERGKVVARNEVGTLHLCGDRIASGYLTGTDLKSFYNDDDDRWYNTGDCAVLDEQGRVFILGRYDNMIRRDGMTIAPATIENVLMKKFPRHTVVVIEVSMPKNQELVCAVFHKPVRNCGEVKDLVVKELGHDHHLDDVFDLPQLGLTDWPYTVVGKLSIVDVRRIVSEYLASQKAREDKVSATGLDS